LKSRQFFSENSPFKQNFLIKKVAYMSPYQKSLQNNRRRVFFKTEIGKFLELLINKILNFLGAARCQNFVNIDNFEAGYTF